jgi:Uma2 family endonuclease
MLEPMRHAAAQQANYRWSDFIALPDDDRRELIDGRLEELDLPTKLHERVIALLSFWLQKWGEKHPGFVVLGSGYKVRITDRRGAMPDIQVYTVAAYRRAENAGLETGHPALAIEVISPTSKAHDRVRKLNWYASIGIPEYWIVDTEAKTIECFRLHVKHYRAVQLAADDEVLKPRTFRGLKIPLKKLFET